MKKILLLMLVMLGVMNASAQKKISIIDAETHNPVPGVIIADTLGEISKGSAQGLAVIPKRKGKIVFAQPYYERLEIDYDSIMPVVKMTHLTMMIEEVEVRGVSGEKIDKNAFTPKTNDVETQLQQAGAGNGNLLGPLSKKLFNRKTKKEKRLEKTKEVLENY